MGNANQLRIVAANLFIPQVLIMLFDRARRGKKDHKG